VGAFRRRDGAAYRLGLSDFERNLARWTAGSEGILVSALARAPRVGRGLDRELRLEYVQLRELTRFLASEVERAAPLSDLLGLIENLERRFAAHETAVRTTYGPAALLHLTGAEIESLARAAPEP
jgi:hypothetical protein